MNLLSTDDTNVQDTHQATKTEEDDVNTSEATGVNATAIYDYQAGT